MTELKNIFDECGLTVYRSQQVYGGDINDAYCLLASSGKFFLKLTDNDRYPAMFAKEANGLNILRQNCTLITPAVIQHGTRDQHQYLLLEWLEKGRPAKNFWENFGADLAAMHKKQQAYFGFRENNYIGSLSQMNHQYKKWSSFYTECRLMPMAKILFDNRSFSSKDIDNATHFCKRLDELFAEEPPALLHGDLWGGNYLVTSSGLAAVFDPAVYFGHREMDIGMTMLFGGFEDEFYRSYNEEYPLEKDWKKRLEYAQLYPLLVHAVLFGGHYITGAKNILSAF